MAAFGQLQRGGGANDAATDVANGDFRDGGTENLSEIEKNIRAAAAARTDYDECLACQ